MKEEKESKIIRENYLAKTDELWLSTREKNQLYKRREIIKSMKFLRLMGNRLRKQLRNELEVIQSSEKLRKTYLKKVKQNSVRQLLPNQIQTQADILMVPSARSKILKTGSTK